MIERIDHVSVAARDRRAAEQFFVDVLGARVVWSQAEPSQGFHWTILEVGRSCLLEVIGATGEKSFLDGFFKSRGDGVHHITLQVEDLDATKRRLEDKGVPTFGMAEPYPGWRELYVHPKDAFGVLLQLAEFTPLDWVHPEDPVPAPYAEFAEKKRQEVRETVLKLGDPLLRRKARPLADVTEQEHQRAAKRLVWTLARVQDAFGFGRAVAAPQIGEDVALVAVDLGKGPQLLADPKVVAKSEAMVTVWDDCLCFPNLSVKVARHATVSVEFVDEQGQTTRWDKIDGETSALLQHEMDHLIGVLAVDRAVDKDSLRYVDNHQP